MFCEHSVYCWRMRRLLAAQNLAAFEKMYDGDIAKVRTMYIVECVNDYAPVPKVTALHHRTVDRSGWSAE